MLLADVDSLVDVDVDVDVDDAGRSVDVIGDAGDERGPIEFTRVEDEDVDEDVDDDDDDDDDDIDDIDEDIEARNGDSAARATADKRMSSKPFDG